MDRFSGKTVLVTGGTSGMGLAGAKRIGGEGGKVAVTGYSDNHLAEARDALPDGSPVLKNDASDPDAAKELAAETKNAFGGLDGLWLNAGFGKFEPNEQVDVESYSGMMDVNVRGPVLQMAELMPLLNDGASVVVTASVSPYLGQAEGAVYAATKGAVTSLARSWAAALADRDIRVNSIAPGPIETNFFEDMGLSEDEVEEFSKQIKQQVPLSRFGRSDEAAAVACFLLSDDASYVTGSQYMVDGGMTMR